MSTQERRQKTYYLVAVDMPAPNTKDNYLYSVLRIKISQLEKSIETVSQRICPHHLTTPSKFIEDVRKAAKMYNAKIIRPDDI